MDGAVELADECLSFLGFRSTAASAAMQTLLSTEAVTVRRRYLGLVIRLNYYYGG